MGYSGLARFYLEDTQKSPVSPHTKSEDSYTKNYQYFVRHSTVSIFDGKNPECFEECFKILLGMSLYHSFSKSLIIFHGLI